MCVCVCVCVCMCVYACVVRTFLVSKLSSCTTCRLQNPMTRKSNEGK